MEIPEVKDQHGRFFHQRDISPNRSFIGRGWQWMRGSALLVGVGADASYLTDHMAKHLDESAVASMLIVAPLNGLTTWEPLSIGIAPSPNAPRKVC